MLNKRENLRKAFDDFKLEKICNYDDEKIQQLLKDRNIIRNKLKIMSTINNSKIFKDIQNEYGTFYNYLKCFTNGKIIYETNKTSSELSDTISSDLRKRGMKFVGTTIIYSYLQAIGIINSHEKECFLFNNTNQQNFAIWRKLIIGHNLIIEVYHPSFIIDEEKYINCFMKQLENI